MLNSVWYLLNVRSVPCSVRSLGEVVMFTWARIVSGATSRKPDSNRPRQTDEEFIGWHKEKRRCGLQPWLHPGAQAVISGQSLRRLSALLASSLSQVLLVWQPLTLGELEANVYLVSGLIKRELYTLIALTWVSEWRLVGQAYLLFLFPGVRVGSLRWTEGSGQVFLVTATRRMATDKKRSVFKGLTGNWGQGSLERDVSPWARMERAF